MVSRMTFFNKIVRSHQRRIHSHTILFTPRIKSTPFRPLERLIHYCRATHVRLLCAANKNIHIHTCTRTHAHMPYPWYRCDFCWCTYAFLGTIARSKRPTTDEWNCMTESVALFTAHSHMHT